ncbi:Uncharacterised protein [Streptococcus pseudoporcinus]|uniref:Uncharacterized protein n=1 Tax=Streptococcus pseudoporcinus TaxID=361101 RepID=A0A4U9XKV6_9STRE|nr:Uncharacterised protein [Streptococcus pseudoporcinus]VUC66004.1 Uncharacterised protein [Streptococcus pseudoporcinus]VUC96931.1 Uncharacterised protein [Streptococcus pseudoporcinus]VUC97319.1 Uncharacterised protein [Streptococcus pseudoporcinus]
MESIKDATISFRIDTEREDLVIVSVYKYNWIIHKDVK